MDATVNPRTLIRAYQGPGLFITGTGTDIGKTTVAAALAAAFHRMHVRVGVCKPVASGCPKRTGRGSDASGGISDEDFDSPDGAVLARAAGLDAGDEALQRFLSPLRFGPAVAPAVAARIEGRAPDWRRVEAALDWWQENCEVLLVEGAGGWYVPADGHYMIADLAAALRLPVLIVTQAGLGAINQSLLTIHAVQARNLAVAGLVINRVPAAGKRDLAVETNLEELPALSGVPIRAVVPEADCSQGVPEACIAAMEEFARVWWRLAGPA